MRTKWSGIRCLLRWACLAWLWAASHPLAAARLPLAAYSTEEGLASDTVERIRQDPAGRLWFACREGLSRFDGLAFVSYGEEDGLPSPRVLDVLGTRDGRIWVATAAGLAVLDTEALGAERFISVPLPLPDDAPEPRINVLFEEPVTIDGEPGLRLWVGTDAGLFLATSRAAGDSEGGSREEGEPRAPPELRRAEAVEGPVRDLVPGRAGELWLAADSGLWHREPGLRNAAEVEAGRAWRRIEGPAGEAPPRRLLWDGGAGGLWMGLEEGGGRWLRVTSDARPEVELGEAVSEEAAFGKAPPGEEEDLWNGLAAGPSRSGLGVAGLEGEVWIATAGGLLEVRDGRRRLLTEADGLPGRQLTAAAVDRDGNLWLGSEGRGAWRLARGGLVSYGAADGLAHPRISSLFEGHDGRLYAGSGDNRFLQVLNPPEPPWESLPEGPSESFTAAALNLPPAATSAAWGWNQGILRGAGGDWWVPTGAGLYRFSGEAPLSELVEAAPKAVLNRESGLASDHVHSLYEDRRGDLWIGGLGGEPSLTRWRRTDGRLSRFGAGAGLPRAAPSAFVEDGEGRLWIGFDDGTLVRRVPGEDRFEALAPGAGHFPDFIYDFLLDRVGRLWIATGQAGLLLVEAVDRGRLDARAWTTAEGLAANTVFALADDGEGRLYLGTPRGVQRLEPEGGALLSLTTGAGLASNVVTEALRDRGGDLWFGTLEGLSRLRPASLSPYESGPAPDSAPDSSSVVAGGERAPGPPLTVLFHQLTVRGSPRPLPALGAARLPELKLGPGAVDVEVAFRAVSFRVGERLRYEVRLGEDEPWRLADAPGRLRLSGLRPGRYDLEVRALRPEGVAAGEPARMAITVVPPFWRRGGVLAVLAGCLLLVAYVAPRLRLGRLLAAERVRRRIATDLHDDLGSNLARISVLSEVLDRRIDGDSETRRLLASVGETAREVSDALDDSIWSIDPGRDDLASLAARLRSFAADVLGGGGVGWHLDVSTSEGTPESFPLSPEVRRNLFLIGKEAITNVARHAGARSVEIELRRAGRWLLLEVRDDGRGPAALPADGEAVGRRESGYGLAGMERRARQLGGELHLGPGEGGGTVVRARLPLGRRAALQRMIMRFSNGR